MAGMLKGAVSLLKGVGGSGGGAGGSSGGLMGMLGGGGGSGPGGKSAQFAQPTLPPTANNPFSVAGNPGMSDTFGQMMASGNNQTQYAPPESINPSPMDAYTQEQKENALKNKTGNDLRKAIWKKGLNTPKNRIGMKYGQAGPAPQLQNPMSALNSMPKSAQRTPQKMQTYQMNPILVKLMKGDL